MSLRLTLVFSFPSLGTEVSHAGLIVQVSRALISLNAICRQTNRLRPTTHSPFCDLRRRSGSLTFLLRAHTTLYAKQDFWSLEASASELATPGVPPSLPESARQMLEIKRDALLRIDTGSRRPA